MFRKSLTSRTSFAVSGGSFTLPTLERIAVWRILLDCLQPAEESLYEALYPGNPQAVSEAMMNLYKDAALKSEEVKP